MDVQTLGTDSITQMIYCKFESQISKTKKKCNSYRSILKKQQISLHIQFTKILKIYNIISVYE